MVIEELTLHTPNVALQRAFFTERLGIAPSEDTDRRVAFQLGRTTLRFEQNAAWTGHYHYALQIPGSQFEPAVEWLKRRCPLLENNEGQQVYVFDIWSAQAVYFADGDGNIAELIAHLNLDSSPHNLFTGESILGVNEIGWAVEDVPIVVQHLGEQYGLAPYRGLSHPEFTAVGGSEGRFIVVTRARPWLPTGEPAASGWFSAVIHTPRGRQTLTAETV